MWLALLVVSIASMVFGGFAASQFRILNARGPLLTDPILLAVSDDGRIYCASGFDRILSYSPDGKVLAAWSLPEPWSVPRIELSGLDRVEVARAGDANVLVYDVDGRLQEARADSAAFERFGPIVAAAGRARFEIRAGALVRTDVDPPAAIVPALPWPLVWFARAPIAIIPFLALGPPGAMVAVALAANGRRH
jgi:hypothetical protein